MTCLSLKSFFKEFAFAGQNAGLMFEHELTLRFSVGDPLTDRQRLMQMVLARGLAPERVITHRLPLSEAAEAYRPFDTRAATRS
jgi:alcohol dehydrogenase